MKIRFAVTAACCSAFYLLDAGAATSISVGTGGGGLNYILNSGAAVATGSAVRVGTFDVSGANDGIVRNSNVFSEVDALFSDAADGGTVTQAANVGGTSLIMNDRDGTSASPGELTGSVGIADDRFGNGDTLYVWVFNSANPAEATEWGIFTRTGWEDPTPAFPGFPAAVDLGTIGDVSNMEALRGSVEPGTGLRLDQVPEPTAAILVFGALGLFGLRRRR